MHGICFSQSQSLEKFWKLARENLSRACITSYESILSHYDKVSLRGRRSLKSGKHDKVGKILTEIYYNVYYNKSMNIAW
jgi:hypothetical protein